MWMDLVQILHSRTVLNSSDNFASKLLAMQRFKVMLILELESLDGCCLPLYPWLVTYCPQAATS